MSLDSFDETRARVDLAAALRLADHFGFSEGICNHFSLAHPTEARVLINPMGRHWSAMQPEHLLWVDQSGASLEAGKTVEVTAAMIHSAIHRAHPNAGCVLHTHMPYATTLCCINGGELQPIHQNCQRFIGDIAWDHQYNGLVDEVGEADRIAALMGNKHILMLANHGVIVAGASVAQAFDALYYLERACELQVLALSTGAPLRLIEPEVVEHTRRQYQRGSTYADPHFQALKRDLLGWSD